MNGNGQGALPDLNTLKIPPLPAVQTPQAPPQPVKPITQTAPPSQVKAQPPQEDEPVEVEISSEGAPEVVYEGTPMDAAPTVLPVEPTAPAAEEAAKEVAPEPAPAPALPSLTVPKPPSEPLAKPTSASAAVEKNLLAEILLGDREGGEADVDIDAALASIPEIEGGPSQGGFSWHTLEVCMHCWRKAYNRFIRGIVKKKRGSALAFGSLYHACWELWYKTGGAKPYDLPCDMVRKAGAPKLAAAVQRLIYVELSKYAAEEAQTWDVRAVEQNAVCWTEPERINGRRVQVPLSCRHDLLYAPTTNGIRAPLGPVPSGIVIVDHKTAGALTYDLTKGYGMDGQFLMNALVYLKSDEVEKFGPLISMLFAVAVKHAEPSANKSFFRVETVVDTDFLSEFYNSEIRPYAYELYRRLTTERFKSAELWPKNKSQCVGRYGCCEYFDLCDVGGEQVLDAYYRHDPSVILSVDKLWEPPAEERKRVAEAEAAIDPAKQAKLEERRIKTEQRKALNLIFIGTLKRALEAFDMFKASTYLPAQSERQVKADVLRALQNAWPPGTPFTIGPSAEGNTFQTTVTEKGFDWQTAIGGPNDATFLKNKVTFKTVAEAICADWWNPQKNKPIA